jgi:hypothetical protein
MQQDLWDDIQECNRLISWSEAVDSVAKKAIAGEIHDSTYMKPEKKYLFELGTQTYPLVVTDIAFNKLSLFNGEIPPKYDEIINTINFLYTEETNYVEEIFERLNDYTLENYNAMFRQHGWMVDLENGNITPEILDYFQRNPIYKSQLIRYKSLLNRLANGNTLRFKNRAIVLYFNIEKITKANQVPEGLRTFAPAQDSSMLAPYIGSYYEGKDAPYPAIVTQKEGRLYASNALLYNIAPDTFQYASYPKNYIYFERGDSNKVVKATIEWDGKMHEGERID